MASMMIIDSDEEIELQLAGLTTKRNLDPTPAVPPPPPPPIGSGSTPKPAASIRSVSAAPRAKSPDLFQEQHSKLAQLISARTVSQQARKVENVFEGPAILERSENRSENQVGCKNGLDAELESKEGAVVGAPGWKGKGREMNGVADVKVDKEGKTWPVFVLDDDSSDSDDGLPAPRLNARATRPTSPAKPLANFPVFAGVSAINQVKPIKVPAVLLPVISRIRTATNAHASTSKQPPPLSPIRVLAALPKPIPPPTPPLPATAAPTQRTIIDLDPSPSPPPSPPTPPVVSPAKAQGPATPTRPRRITGNSEEGALKVSDKASFLLVAQANALRASASPVKIPPAKTTPIAERVRKKRNVAVKKIKEIVGKKKGRGKRRKGIFVVAARKATVNSKSDKRLEQEMKKVVKLAEPLSEAEHAIALEKYLAGEKSKAPSARSIAGPSFEGEFNSDLQNDLFRTRRGGSQSLPGDTVLFQSMIDESLAHDRGTGTVTVCSRPEGPFSPPFEFVYTNRVVYPPSVLPVPSPSCNCIGACSNALDSPCACRKHQTEIMSRTRYMGVERSDIKGFAYDRNGILRTELDEPIHECGSDCSCGATCQNRQMDRGVTVDVELFHAGMAGWAVRNGPTKIIRKGQPIATYAGELLKPAEGNLRYKVYKKMVNRVYIFALANWSIREALQGPDVENAAHVAEYDVDAFFKGNFTRFLNHRCVPNVVIRILYLDDADPRRPSFVFVAKKDIQPGDEMSISYFSSEDPALDGLTKKQYQANAIEERMNATKGRRCYCGEELCRGVTFAAADVNDDGVDSSDTSDGEEQEDEEDDEE